MFSCPACSGDAVPSLTQPAVKGQRGTVAPAPLSGRDHCRPKETERTMAKRKKPLSAKSLREQLRQSEARIDHLLRVVKVWRDRYVKAAKGQP